MKFEENFEANKKHKTKLLQISIRYARQYLDGELSYKDIQDINFNLHKK